MSGGPPLDAVVVKLEAPQAAGSSGGERRRFFPKAVKRPEPQAGAAPAADASSEPAAPAEGDVVPHARRENKSATREQRPTQFQAGFDACSGSGGLAPVLQGNRIAGGVKSKGDAQEEAAPALHTLRDQTRNFPTSLPISVDQADPSAHLQEDNTACFMDSGSEELREDTLFLIQLPALLPLPLDPKAAREKKPEELKTTLGGYPSGQCGKMVVYKSGKIKLKLGNCMMDVSLAKSGTFAQSLAAVNLADDNCYFLGDVTHTMVVSPALSELPLDHRSDQAVDTSHSSAHPV
jgi:hypothetical protein